MMGEIPFFIESENGHETEQVPKEKVAEEVKKQLIDGKWVSVEKNDGTTELLTKSDLPKEEDTADNLEWAEKFENVRSATATKTVKGG